MINEEIQNVMQSEIALKHRYRAEERIYSQNV